MWGFCYFRFFKIKTIFIEKPIKINKPKYTQFNRKSIPKLSQFPYLLQTTRAK